MAEAKIIQLASRARTPGRVPVDSIRIEKADGNVLVTVADLQFTLTPAQAKLVGEHLTVLAVVLGETP